MQKIHIGTSGFYYDHWIGPCYPEGSPKNTLLDYYARNFSTVELNTTFYHFPRRAAVEHWVAATPEEFLFSVKASRAVTHMRRLEDTGEVLKAFMQTILPMQHKLGVVLFQLPPFMEPDLPLLERFLTELPEGYRYAFEFRNVMWLDERLFGLLERYGVSLCINDFGQDQTPWIATADHVYIRMHGPLGNYAGSYSDNALDMLVKRIYGLAGAGHELFCYFNNDMQGYAWANAKALQQRFR